MARVARRQFVRSARKPSTWSRTVSTAPLTVAAGTKAVFTTFVLNNVGIGETVRRTRGAIMVASDQTSNFEFQFGALGFVVVSDLAIAAGAASIPGPVTEAQDDGWFVWQAFLRASSQSVSKNALQYFEFDSKAMRRIEEGFGVAVMVENAHATHGMQVALQVSMLTTIS